MTTSYGDDLPQELLDQLARTHTYVADGRTKILSLFEGGKILTTNDILVAFYRKYDEILPRKRVQSYLSRLVSQGHLKRTGVGLFTLL